MKRIADILRPDAVVLSLRAKTHTKAIEEVARVLKHDERVLDWKPLLKGFEQADPCLPVTAEFGICLPHARTEHVSSMVMSVGRSLAGIPFPGCTPPIRYLFCIGIQHSLAADYLRIIGLLARIIKVPESEECLRHAATGQEFIEHLARLEAKL